MSAALAQIARVIAWTLTFILTGFGLRALFTALLPEGAGAASREAQALPRVIGALHSLQERVEAGLVPDDAAWESLRLLPPPWGRLTHSCLRELRDAGGSILPTLRRLRDLATEHREALGDAKARSSQAVAQAGACAALVPVFGGALWLLMPGVEEHPWAWCTGLGVAILLALCAAGWILQMAEKARWAGLQQERRSWVLGAQCAGERLLAQVRSGVPSDIAWTKSLEWLESESPGLGTAWGFSVWSADAKPGTESPGAESRLREAGATLRRAIQASVLEGRPCTERIEGVLAALRSSLRSEVQRELGLLGTRALQPLFLLVAPSLLGLLAFGFYLGWQGLVGG